jgi:divalent metal cation (Fe/Co/Zn/Cd) transporter
VGVRVKDIFGFNYEIFRGGFVTGVILGFLILFFAMFVGQSSLLLLIFFILGGLSPLGVAYLKLRRNKTNSDANLAGILVGFFCSLCFLLFYMFVVFYFGTF